MKYPGLFIWAERIVLTSLFILPVFYIRSSLFPYTTPKAFLIITAALLINGLLMTLWLQNKAYAPRISNVFILYAAYIVWLCISSIFGENFSVSWWGTFRLGNGLVTQIAIALYVFGVMWILQKKDIKKNLAQAIALGGTGLVVYIFTGILIPGNEFLVSQWGGGTFGNNSFAAVYLTAAIAAAIYLIISASRTWKWVWGIVLAMLACNPIFVGFTQGTFGFGEARAATLSLIVGLVGALIVYFAFSAKKTIRISAYISGVIGIVIIGICVVVLYGNNSFAKKYLPEETIQSRLIYTDIALQGIQARPLMGYGWEHFPVTYQEFFNPINLTPGYTGEDRLNEPHNMVLQVGSASGIPGMMLYVAFLSIVIFIAIWYIKKQVYTRTTGAIFFGFFVSYFIQDWFLFDVPATQTVFLVFVIWMLSYGFSSVVPNKKEYLPFIDNKTLRRVTTVLVWVIIAVMMYHFVYRPLLESNQLRSLSTMTIKERSDAIKNGIFETSPMGYIYSEGDLLYSYARQYSEIISNLNPDERVVVQEELIVYKNIINNRIQFNPRYTRLQTAGILADFNLFSLTGDKRYLVDAEQLGYESIVLSPNNPKGYWLLSQALATSGKIAEALQIAQKAINIEPSIEESHRILSKLLDVKVQN